MRSELTANTPEQGLKVARTGHIAKASQSPAAHVTTTSRTLNEQGPRHTSIVRFHPLFSQIESRLPVDAQPLGKTGRIKWRLDLGVVIEVNKNVAALIVGLACAYQFCIARLFPVPPFLDPCGPPIPAPCRYSR